MNAEITANRARFSALEFSSSTLRVYYLPLRTISAAVAHFLDMEGVTGSIPVSSTLELQPIILHIFLALVTEECHYGFEVEFLLEPFRCDQMCAG